MNIEILQRRREAVLKAFNDGLIPKYQAQEKIRILTQMIEYAAMIGARKQWAR